MSEENLIGKLVDRRLIEIGGADAASFLQCLITTDVKTLMDAVMMAGALLSPQGKVLCDFLVTQAGERFFIDVGQLNADFLIKRLALYKLRSKVDIIPHPPMITTISKMAGNASFCFIDGRFGEGESIMRLYAPLSDLSDTSPAVDTRHEWDRLRIRAALAESGTDFAVGDVFAHDINLDQIGGLSFNKGCYIGQEVVSRMHYRGTARRRLLQVHAQAPLPPVGTDIVAGGKLIGVLGSSVVHQGLAQGLAIARLDRVKSALDSGLAITANDVELRLRIPERVHFNYPDSGKNIQGDTA